MKLKYCIGILGLIFLTGCASNPYSKFYSDRTMGINVSTDDRFEQQSAPPKMFAGTSLESDYKMMVQRGYVLLGTSSFNAGETPDKLALAHARKIYADIVLTYFKYTETLSGNMPLILPDTQTSTTYMSGNVYGSGGGYANYSGNAYTTSYGSKTTYIPYNVRRYDYFASYWKKAKMPRFGGMILDLSDASKKALESNKGAEVGIVREGSPAFNADVLEGDIILEINNTQVTNAPHVWQLVFESKGKKTPFKIFRNGCVIEKEIVLND